MCGSTSKTMEIKEINYKGYVISINKELAYSKRLNKIFYEISASTKESIKYYQKLKEYRKDLSAIESEEPKDPNWKTGKYISSYISMVAAVDNYKRRGIKTQKQINDVVKLFKKKIDKR